VPENDDFGTCDNDLLGGDSGAGRIEAVKDAVDVLKMLPDKLANPGVLGNDLVATIVGLVARGWTFDSAIIHKGVSYVRDLGGKKESYVIMENGYGIGPTLGETSQSQCTNRGLNSGEVAQGNVDGAMVVANKQIEHGIACPASHGLYNLVSERRNARVVNRDGIERL
jgi:hypothetical protein